MRDAVVAALIKDLDSFTNDELRWLRAGVSQEPLANRFAKFADRLPETKAVCDFLPKVDNIVLTPL